ncbi:MAG TPA: tetratricopeptide repeat protein [Brumimicrobium sp.]|nr:tetratricopeptide repeat protein [Brumimicrobium sp.]
MYINSEHKKAQELMDEEKYDKALIAFNKALELNPNDPNILSHRGVLYLHLNQKRKCFDDLELSLNLDNGYAYRYAALAYAREFFGDLDGAIELYEKAVELEPDDAIAHNNLGLLREKKGYQQQAKRSFEKADKLAEIQKDFFAKIDGDEKSRTSTNGRVNNSEGEEKTNPLPKPGSLNLPQGEKLQPKKLTEKPRTTFAKVLKDIFTNKKAFKEFINFIRNGFKLDKNDT